jgi:hypothetical protein
MIWEGRYIYRLCFEISGAKHQYHPHPAKRKSLV